jgi:PAS domain S-box-containing protein
MRDVGVELLAEVLQQMPAGVVIARPDGSLLMANERLRATWGREDWGERHAWEDWSRFPMYTLDGAPLPGPERPLARSALRGEVVRDVDVLLDLPDGRRRTMRLSSGPVRSSDGTIVAAVGTVLDITDRLVAGRALELAERRYHALFESSVVGVLIASDRDIVEANDAFLEMVAYSREDLEAGRISWRDMTPAEHAGADAHALEQLRTAGSAAAFEKEYVRKDGRRVPVLLGCVRLREEPLQVLAYVVDLTERRAAERQRDVVLASEQEARRRLAGILAGISDAFFAVDAGWRFTYVNAQAEALLERHAFELLGRRIWDEFPASAGSVFEVSYRRAVDTAEPVTFEAFYEPLDRWFEVRAHPSGDGLAVFFQDINDRKRAEARAAALRELADELVRVIEPDEVARVVVEQGMRALGASAGLLAFERNADTLRLAFHQGYQAHVRDWTDWPKDFPGPVNDALRTRDLVLVHTRDEWAERYPELLHTVRHEAYASVPLLLEGDVIGCIGLSFDGVQAFAAEDRELLREIARRCAQAVERGRLYHERSEVARTLQHGLLPGALPEIPGVRLAADLQPLGLGSEVGGDFYDAFQLADGRWLIAMGDVCGKGAEAALLTSLARHTLEAVALLDPDPVRVLGRINEGLRRRGDGQFLSMVVLVLDPAGGRVTVVSAGHPPVVRLREGEPPEPLRAQGLLLGIDKDPPLVPLELELQAGDTLVLYTDGVTEARVHGELFGEPRLMETLAACDPGNPRGVIAGVRTALDAFDGGHALDDQALLVIHAETASESGVEAGWTLGYRSVS